MDPIRVRSPQRLNLLRPVAVGHPVEQSVRERLVARMCRCGRWVVCVDEMRDVSEFPLPMEKIRFVREPNIGDDHCLDGPR